MNNLDLARAVRAPFEDKDWPMKTLLGFLWALLIVTMPAVYGAQLEYIRRVSRGDDRLPDWNDFGDKWVQGFLVFIAGLIYFLPVIVLAAIFAVPAILATARGGDTDAFAALLTGGMCLFFLFATVYGIAVSILFNAAVVHFAMTGRFGSFFEFGAIMSKVRGPGGYFTAWLYALVISIVLSTAVSIITSISGGLLSIVSFVATYLTAIMTGHVLGQWAAYSYGVTAPAAAYTGQVPPPPAPPA